VGVFVSFSRWLSISIPFACLSVVGSWAYLCIVLNPDDVKSIPIVVYKRDNKLSNRNIAVIVLSLITLFLFSTFELVKPIFGDIGIVSCLFVAIMFGSGMLTEVSDGIAAAAAAKCVVLDSILYLMSDPPLPSSQIDFNSLSWHTLFLLGGGNVLGKAIESSGLLASISTAVTAGE
jgi:phosphate transporter